MRRSWYHSENRLGRHYLDILGNSVSPVKEEWLTKSLFLPPRSGKLIPDNELRFWWWKNMMRIKNSVDEVPTHHPVCGFWAGSSVVEFAFLAWNEESDLNRAKVGTRGLARWDAYLQGFFRLIWWELPFAGLPGWECSRHLINVCWMDRPTEVNMSSRTLKCHPHHPRPHHPRSVKYAEMSLNVPHGLTALKPLLRRPIKKKAEIVNGQ